MYEADMSITYDVRKEMTEHVIPATIDFLKSVGSFYSLADFDCMDGIRIEEPFHRADLAGMYTIDYKSGDEAGRIRFSFLTYPAAELWNNMQLALEDLGLKNASIYPKVHHLYADDTDPALERTKWTVEFSFETGEDLCGAFKLAYFAAYQAVKRCFLIYKLYEEVKDLRAVNTPFSEVIPDVFDFASAEDISPYGTLYSAFYFGDRYYRTTTDHGTHTEKVFKPDGIDFAYTTVNVNRDRLGSDVTIRCRTEIEEDIGEPYTSNVECTQSFSIAPPRGKVRSLLHNGHEVARLHYVRPEVFVLQPLDLYLTKPLDGIDEAGEKIKFLIVTRDPDGSYSFFAETGKNNSGDKPDRLAYQHRLVAWSGINEDDSLAWDAESGEKYELSLDYNLRHMLPLFAAIEDWAFAPEDICDPGNECAGAGELSFSKLNEDCRRLISIVQKWFGKEPDEGDDFLSSPGARILTYLEWERPDLLKAYREGTDRELMEDIYFVQRVKNAAYGVDSDLGLDEIRKRLKAVGLGDPPDCRQVTMADMLESDRYPDREETGKSEL